MPTDDHAIVFDRVEKRYDTGSADVEAIRGLSFAIREGEVFGILGESGAGKSTILHLMNGLERATGGSVRVLGADLGALGAAELRALRKNIGVVFQGFNLLSNQTVRQNVALPLVLQGARDTAWVAELLQFVGLTSRAEHYPAQLSGGEQQRVALARALATRPRILLLDEPTSALDLSTTREILALIRETREQFGTTIAIVTHELGVVKALCARAALIDRGALREIVTVRPRVAEEPQAYLDHAREYLEE